MADLAIIIPVYNEGEGFFRLFDEICRKVKTAFKIYVIYDFDEDTTVPVIKNLAVAHPGLISGVKNYYGRGVVGALKTGFKAVAEPAALVTMGDLSDDLSDVDKMYDMLSHKGYDLVCGSRYIKGGKQIGGPPLKGFFSRMIGLTLPLLIGIPSHDLSNSFKLYRKSLLDAIKLESDGGFEIGMEITVKAYLMGHKIGEIPTIWRDRAQGRSNFKLWQWAPKYIRWYLAAIFGKIKHILVEKG